MKRHALFVLLVLVLVVSGSYLASLAESPRSLPKVETQGPRPFPRVCCKCKCKRERPPGQQLPGPVIKQAD